MVMINDVVSKKIIKCKNNISSFTQKRIEKVQLGMTRYNDARNTSRSEMESFIVLPFVAGVRRASL